MYGDIEMYLCLVRMLLWNPGLGRHRVSAVTLLSDIILICESLLIDRLRHVAWVHLRITLRHADTGLLWWEMLRGRFFGRLDGFLDTVFAIASRFRRVQTGLGRVSRYPE